MLRGWPVYGVCVYLCPKNQVEPRRTSGKRNQRELLRISTLRTDWRLLILVLLDVGCCWCSSLAQDAARPFDRSFLGVFGRRRCVRSSIHKCGLMHAWPANNMPLRTLHTPWISNKYYSFGHGWLALIAQQRTLATRGHIQTHTPTTYATRRR